MARFLFWSDLHMVHHDFTLPAKEDLKALGPIDGVLLGGDIDRGCSWIDLARKIHNAFSLPSVMVWGNHEPYGFHVESLLATEKRELASARRDGVDARVLHGAQTIINGARIIGASLWSTFDLDGHPELSMAYAARYMNDYRAIRSGKSAWEKAMSNKAKDDHEDHALATAMAIMNKTMHKNSISGPIGELITPKITRDWALRDRKSLARLLGKHHDGPTVVMTHHMPLRGCIGKKYFGDPLTPAFCNAMEKEVGGWLGKNAFDAWIYGHSHENNELQMMREDGKMAIFLSNPRGYPSEWTRFDPLRILEI